MITLIDGAARILEQSQRRLETAAMNVSNAATAGYKRSLNFSDALDATPPSVTIDFTPGKLSETGEAFDLSLSEGALLAVRRGGDVLYTRAGRLRRDDEGRVVTLAGDAVQMEGGGDLILAGADFNVARDGRVLAGEQSVGRLALTTLIDPRAIAPAGGGAFRTDPSNAASALDAQVRQGAYETSNVSMGEEMVAMMEALRRAETGQRLANTYDDLMGRALTAFGRA